MKTLSYIKCDIDEEVEIGKEYYWGQLSFSSKIDEDLTTAFYDNENDEWLVIEFEIVEYDKENVLDTLIKVVDIY